MLLSKNFYNTYPLTIGYGAFKFDMTLKVRGQGHVLNVCQIVKIGIYSMGFGTPNPWGVDAVFWSKIVVLL